MPGWERLTGTRFGFSPVFLPADLVDFFKDLKIDHTVPDNYWAVFPEGALFMADSLQEKLKKFGLPTLKSLGATLCCLLAFLVAFEVALQIPGLVRILPIPAPSLESHYPELGVKFQRLFQVKKVNCLFIGSSMIDAGLDPVIFENGLDKENGRKNTCFNLGYAGMQTEASTAIANTVTYWHPVDLVVFGLSPLDLSSIYTKTRSVARMPVFTYYGGKPSLEGWLFNHLRLPWYFAALPRSSEPAYLSEQVEWDELLTARGIRQTNDIGKVNIKDQEVTLTDFHINPADMQALENTLLNFKSRGIQPIVVEFPVHPVYYPYIIEGGEAEYHKRFIEPVKEFMDQNDILFIQTQDMISSIVTDSDWFNRNHLNITGAGKFTNFVLDEIQAAGGVK
jgi:hypothetical protein